MASFQQRRFEKNAAFLARYFTDTSKMDGIIIKIEVEEPYINYAKTFGDPMLEQTLQLTDTDNNTILLYKADHRVPTSNIMKGVTVMKSYRLTEDNIVRVPMAPAAVPKMLEKRIFQDYIDKISRTLQNTQLTSIEVDEFLNTHFVPGDMTPLSVVIRKPNWHKSFRDCVDVKVVSICRSCRKKAHKECCAQYNSTNRTTALMVIGWAEVNTSVKFVRPSLLT